MLESLSHKSVLARGFALVQGADGALAKAADLNAGDRVRITFTDGPKDADIVESGAGPAKKKAKPGGDQGSLF
jgi:exodeoxyribonuclease VII large subunit